VPDGGPTAKSLLRPGKNCWSARHAERIALLVDGEEYFGAFAAAAERARRSIVILAWDFNSHTGLRFDDPDEALLLGDFLNSLARRRRSLDVRVLIWDYPMIFGTEREFPPTYGLGWKPHRRVRVRYDNTHPVTGSHHQKIVVIDDRVAFCGGSDLTSGRWDTCEHRPDEPRRKTDGSPYPPFHDVMMMVDGTAARALGELARERWRRATGRKLSAPRRVADPWPSTVEPHFKDAPIAISRTLPARDGQESVREIESLYLDMIAAAQRYIFFENQYFTAQAIGEALAARLAEPEGPEIVVVLRLLSHGWLEELTMQNLRRNLIDRLQKADHAGRFHVYYPFIDGLAEGTCIDVHSKVMIVDDQWLRVGSSNISNRSMGFDSECDLTLEARGRDDLASNIRSFRDRLLAEHVGVAPKRLAREIATQGSLGAAIDKLASPGRALRRLENSTVPEAVVSLASIADPEQPVSLENLTRQFAPRSEVRLRSLRWLKLTVTALIIAALAAMWQFTPVGEMFTPVHVTQWARTFGEAPWAPLVVLTAFTPAAIVMFPRPLITLFAVVAFGPWLGFGYSMAGILISALFTYWVGTRMDRSTVRKLAGPKLSRILDVLRRRGIVALTALRLVPLAPFTIEGIVAGAIRVPLRDFTLGTAIGMLPGTLAATVFGDQLEIALRDPAEVNLWIVAGVAVALTTATLLVRRWLSTQAHEPSARA
jgi:phosphatidylserine/phosphatidylglycerophosphate/cardiolipin synthase-like enzyme/membrane protein DedA with SNARE-associated domain